MTDEKMQRICRRLFDCIPDGTSEKEFLFILGNFILGSLEKFNYGKVNHPKIVLDKINCFCALLMAAYEDYMVSRNVSN